jgi:uncharacterized protein (TIGR02271 family)
MTMHTVTAMFHSKSEADRAANNLRANAALSATNIKVLPDEDVQHTGAAEPGFFAALRNFFMPEEDRYGFAEGMRRGDYMVAVDTDEEHAQRVMDVLEEAGAIDLDAEEERWRREGWQPGAARTGESVTTGGQAAGLRGTAMPGTAGPAGEAIPSAATTTTGPLTDRSSAASMAASSDMTPGGIGASRSAASTTRTAEGRTGTLAGAPGGLASAAGDRTTEERIPLVEERLRVGKRQAVAGRVRIRSYVVETPVTETVRLREEHVEVERRPVDRALTGNEADPFREREIEATETREEPVVSKEARVREELVLHKTVEERDETVRDTVRRTEVREDRGEEGAAGVTPDPVSPRRP